MKNILVWTFALLLMGVFVQPAQAFMIEPYVGWEQGDSDQGNTSEDFDAIAMGARLGWRGLGLFAVGIDYQMSTGKNEASVEQDYNFTDMGLFVMVEFPILLRLHVTYLFSSEMTVEQPLVADTTLSGSGGTKIGVSYTGLPFLSVNADMITRKWDESEQGGTTTSIDNSGETLMLSISLPLP